jgi:spore cortex formation protein SpoVR/YcgB (stage V sporulation)
MNKFEEETVTALTTLLETVEALQKINFRDMLKPEMYVQYEQTLQGAYDALTQVEQAINGLGMKLEYQHWRLGEAVEELKPLLTQTHAPSDEITALSEGDLFSN